MSLLIIEPVSVRSGRGKERERASREESEGRREGKREPVPGSRREVTHLLSPRSSRYLVPGERWEKKEGRVMAGKYNAVLVVVIITITITITIVIVSI